MSGRASQRLRRAWLWVTVAMTLGLLAGTAGVWALAGPGGGLGWVLPAGGAVAFELWFLRSHLHENRAGGEATATTDPYETLGPANLVTLARGGLFAGVAGFALVAPNGVVAWLPALCYGTGCALDAVDGALARRRGQETLLGARLDMAVDTMGFLVAPVVAVLWGRLPVWYLSLSLARYLFKAGRGLRRRRGRPVYDLPESRLRRPLAGLQMAFITLALAPLVPARVVTALAAVVLVPSLAVFGRDYLAISGRLGTKNEQSDTPSQG